MLKYIHLRFAAYIKTFGILLHYSEASFLKRPNTDNVISTILGFLTFRNIDPIVLTAACQFMHSILTNQDIQNDHELNEKYVKSTQTLEKVLPYLGGPKYKDACEQLAYYNEQTQGDKKIAVPLSKLNSTMMQSLFISIINLITFICARALDSDHTNFNQAPEDDIMKQLYAKFSDTLNQKDRETLLFNCLEVPSDDVKLAVAKCLDKIKISEIDTDEISHLVRLVGAQKNLGAGKTEEVLSLIFLILTKVMKERSSTSREFTARYAQFAVADCLDILVRNMARNLMDQPEEQEEKVSLAIACIFFLKVASLDPSIRTNLIGERASHCLKISLHCEECFMPNYPLPMDVESTFIGKNVEFLFQCMTGDAAVETLFHNFVQTDQQNCRHSD